MVSRNDMQLATIDSRIYKPRYNTDTDSYEDICPYLPYQRNCIKYDCECGSNSYFDTMSKYKSHIQSKIHKRWLSHTHPKNVEEDKEIKRLNKELRISKQQNNKQKKITAKLRKELIESRKKNKEKKY